MPMRWTFSTLICLGLLALAAVTYWPVTTCDFVNLDDAIYIANNHDQLTELTWSSWTHFWNHTVCNNWHPVTMFSLAIDTQLWGDHAIGYHVTNVAIHALNSMLLFIVLYQMTNCSVRSAIVAALFAVHPLHVESVAWISERKDVLSTFFLILTIAAYIQYASRPALARYGFVFVLMILGLLSKPMLVTLPLLLLLLDVWPLHRIQQAGGSDRFPKRKFTWLVVEKIPLLVLSLADGLLTISIQKSAQVTLSGVRFEYRFAHMFSAYFWYLKKTLLPINLVALNPHPENNIAWVDVTMGLLTFVAITALVLRFAKSKPHLLVGWLWFVIALLPVIGLIQVGGQAYADRYAYIPHIGLFAGLVWEMGTWVSQHRTTRLLSGAVTTTVIVVCAVLSHTQVGYWKNSETLWEHALDVDPGNGLAHLFLGDDLLTRDQPAKACPHFETGLKLTHQYAATGYADWGLALLQLNRPDEAEQKLRAALKINPHHKVAERELIQLLTDQHRIAEAVELTKRGDKTSSPTDSKPTPNVRDEVEQGMRDIREGKIAQAKVHFERATRMAPNSAATFYNLANAQKQLGELSDAKQNFLKALELNPQLSGAHHNLAAILEREQNRSDAQKHYAEAYRINPQDLVAKQHADRLSNPE